MTNLLTKAQKTAIAIKAGEAYKLLASLDLVGGLSANDWRRAEVKQLTGKDSTTLCNQLHYVPLFNHFCTLLGAHHKQDNTYTPRAKSIYNISQAMGRWELSNMYLFAIIQDKFPQKLEGYQPADSWEAITSKLTDNELQQVLFTINNRGRAKTRSVAKRHNID